MLVGKNVSKQHFTWSVEDKRLLRDYLIINWVKIGSRDSTNLTWLCKCRGKESEEWQRLRVKHVCAVANVQYTKHFGWHENWIQAHCNTVPHPQVADRGKILWAGDRSCMRVYAKHSLHGWHLIWAEISKTDSCLHSPPPHSNTLSPDAQGKKAFDLKQLEAAVFSDVN